MFIDNKGSVLAGERKDSEKTKVLGSTLTSKIKDNGPFQGQCVLDPGLCLLANRGVVHHMLQSGGGGTMTREPTRILHLK